MSSNHMKLDYNHFLEMIDANLADNENAWHIEVGLNLLTSYLKSIAERTLEINDEVLIGLLVDLCVLKESAKENKGGKENGINPDVNKS